LAEGAFLDARHEGDGVTSDLRAQRVRWVAAMVMPHEPAVRRWLARSRIPADQIDDLIQDAYCRFAGLASVDAIEKPGAYFFRIVRNQIAENIRRDRVVRIETVTELDALPVLSEEPSAERIFIARRELAEVIRLIDSLPDRCREVIRLRKIEGLSQKQIAGRLGVTESIVENDVAKGMRLISNSLSDRGGENERDLVLRDYERTRNG
jgi:RNA polymerase sigma-70 factor (ECF subfamily)